MESVNYTISNELYGEGGCSSVYLTSNNENKTYDYVTKVYNSNKIGQKEINIMEYINKFSIRNISQLVTHGCTNDDELYLITKRIEGLETFQYINMYSHVSENLAKNWFKCLLDSVYDLHNIGIIHGDIKTENILINDMNFINSITLIDFSNSKKLSKGQSSIYTNKLIGTAYYMAPETINEYEYSYQTDVWAMGVTLYTWLSGGYPFKSIEKAKLGKYKSMETEKWSHVSTECKDLIKLMLTVDKSKRINIKDIYAHSWINSSIDIEDSIKPFNPVNKPLDNEVNVNKNNILYKFYHRIRNIINNKQTHKVLPYNNTTIIS